MLELNGVNQFGDDFSSTHNYLTQGTAGTIWDGVNTDFAGAIDSNITSSGELTITADTGSGFNGGTGPILYREVTGDFIASVRVVTAPLNAYSGFYLMARASISPDEAGTGEDNVGNKYFVGTPFEGQLAHQQNDGARTTDARLDGNNLYPYMQLERSGSDFILRYGTNPDISPRGLQRAAFCGISYVLSST